MAESSMRSGLQASGTGRIRSAEPGPAVAEQGSLISTADALDRVLTSIRDEIGGLASRLDPILRPATDTAKDASPVKEAQPVSAYGHLLAVHVDRARDILRELMAIRSRIDL